MKKNMSKVDGIIRIIISLVVITLWYTGQISGIALIVLGIIAGIFLVTGFINFCPLYAAFRIQTRKSEG